MQALPAGIQSFQRIRDGNYIYVDKTARLCDIISKGERYFLSRPRRFGKSLTLSTLEAMFSGKAELFRGLAAEEWVEERSSHPSPVLRLDISTCESRSPALFQQSLQEMLSRLARRWHVPLHSTTSTGMFQDLIEGVYERKGYIVLLIDEYDTPILDTIGNPETAEKMRAELRSVYSVLKSCDDCFSFVFLTGISRFSKVGVFSVLNNLLDISQSSQYGDITGYTQEELENTFGDWIEFSADQLSISSTEVLSKLHEYYDGFSFDGTVRLYNPFSILSFFSIGEFNNYWYESGSPSFIVEWMKKYNIKDPEEYRHITVKNTFITSDEIENAAPESFLFQSGYLTIEEKHEQLYILDYPNREVLDSVSGMYLRHVYKVEKYAVLGNEIWKALREKNSAEVVRLYNIALGAVPYDDFSRNRNEFWYRSMFVMLLRGAGIITYNEPHTSKGRADVVLQFNDIFFILEFKYAEKSSDVEKKKREGLQQIEDMEYARTYDAEGRTVITAVLVADNEKKTVLLA